MMANDQTQISDRKRPDAPENVLLQLHLAEYGALTNRCTYRFYMQFGIWGYLLLSVPLVYSLHFVDEVVPVWVAVLTLQCVHGLWLQNLIEVYRCIDYIEQVLRPLVAQVLPTGDKFWEYERYLSRLRPDKIAWWEFSFPLVTTAAMLAAGAIRYWQMRFRCSRWSEKWWEDALLISINILTIFLLTRATIAASRLRRRMTKAPDGHLNAR